MKRILKGQSTMDNPETLATLTTQDEEKTEGAINNGQSRDTGNIATQDEEKTEGAINNGQSRDTGNIDHTRRR